MELLFTMDLEAAASMHNNHLGPLPRHPPTMMYEECSETSTKLSLQDDAPKREAMKTLSSPTLCN
jgi:hypothetical protein